MPDLKKKKLRLPLQLEGVQGACAPHLDCSHTPASRPHPCAFCLHCAPGQGTCLAAPGGPRGVSRAGRNQRSSGRGVLGAPALPSASAALTLALCVSLSDSGQQQPSSVGNQSHSASDPGPIRATAPMWRCSRIMHMQRELHPTLLSSLEGIVDQMVWFRENWHEEVRGGSVCRGGRGSGCPRRCGLSTRAPRSCVSVGGLADGAAESPRLHPGAVVTAEAENLKRRRHQGSHCCP